MGTEDSRGCPILHVDMDAFYASVALREHPELVDRPVIVGGGYRGVVLSANYPARRHGVRSALPMTRARRLCPEAVVISPNERTGSGASLWDTFGVASSAVMEIFRSYTPLVEVLSLDEAFLDVRGAARRLGDPVQIAERIRAQVHDEQGLACSVGVAAVPTLAKLASRRAKPDGVQVLSPDRIAALVHPLDVGELWGVGDRTRDQLHRFGLRTIGDVAHAPVRTLRRALGDRLGDQLHALAWGEDHRRLTPRRGPDEPERSIGADETFGRDTDDREVVVRELLRLTAKVTARMRAAELVGRTVTVRVRFADFTTITRSRTLRDATDVTQEIFRAATALYDGLGLQRARLRLVGVRVEGLMAREGTSRQLVLGERAHGWADADRAVDRAALRFGGAAVRPASLLAPTPK